MKRLSIILVHYNNWTDTKDCLISLSNVISPLSEAHVIVVDNGSKSSIKSSINQLIKRSNKLKIKYIQNKNNLGFSGGNNVGIKYALEHDADYILLLNNDTVVDSHFIDPLIKFFETHEKAGIIGPKIFFHKGYEYHKDRYREDEKGRVIWYAGGIIDWDNVFASHRGVDEVDIGRYIQPEKTPFVSGCAMMFRSSLVSKIGMLDEKYFMYLEDVDYCMRAKRAGYELWFIPKSFIWHKNAQSSGKSGSDLHVYYQTRNRLYFGMKYATFRTKFALIRNSIHVLRSRENRRVAVVDFYMHRFGKRQSLHQDSKK